MYRVSHVVVHLGWVDLDFGCLIICLSCEEFGRSCLAAGQHGVTMKSKSTQPRCSTATRWDTLYSYSFFSSWKLISCYLVSYENENVIEQFVPATAAAAKPHAHVWLLPVHHEVVLRLGIVAARQAKELVFGRLPEKHAVRFPGGTAQSQALCVPEISTFDMLSLHVEHTSARSKYSRPHSELVVGSGHEVWRQRHVSSTTFATSLNGRYGITFTK